MKVQGSYYHLLDKQITDDLLIESYALEPTDELYNKVKSAIKLHPICVKYPAVYNIIEQHMDKGNIVVLLSSKFTLIRLIYRFYIFIRKIWRDFGAAAYYSGRDNKIYILLDSGFYSTPESLLGADVSKVCITLFHELVHWSAYNTKPERARQIIEPICKAFYSAVTYQSFLSYRWADTLDKRGNKAITGYWFEFLYRFFANKHRLRNIDFKELKEKFFTPKMYDMYRLFIDHIEHIFFKLLEIWNNMLKIQFLMNDISNLTNVSILRLAYDKIGIETRGVTYPVQELVVIDEVPAVCMTYVSLVDSSLWPKWMVDRIVELYKDAAK